MTTARVNQAWVHHPRQPVDRAFLLLGAGVVWVLLLLTGLVLLML